MMEQAPDDNLQQSAEEAVPLGVGRTLREARERMGLAVEDVVNRLKFAPRQIQALEEDAFEQLPEGAFLRGFVRSYARLLQLDEAPLLAALPDARMQEAAPAAQQSVEVPFPGVYSMRRSNIAWLAAALLVALALGLFTWLYGHKPVILAAHESPVPATVSSVSGLGPAPAPVSAVAAVSPSRAAAPAPAAAAPAPKIAQSAAAPQPKVKFHISSGTGPIRMVFDGDSWVEVKDKDGKLLMSQVNTAGSEQYLDGNPPFTLTIGHASGVKLFYKGKQVDLAPFTNAEVAHVTLE